MKLYVMVFPFAEGNFSLKNEARDSRPNKLNSGLLNVVVTETSTVLARQFNVSHTTEKNGEEISIRKWVPHELSPENLRQCVSCCEFLLSLHLQTQFLKKIITCDEKWIFQNNVKRRRLWINRGKDQFSNRE